MSVIDNIRLTFLYIEFYSMGKTWVYPESYIPYNIFRYIVKGKAEFCIDGEEIIVKENQIVYIPQGCRMSCRALSESFEFSKTWIDYVESFSSDIYVSTDFACDSILYGHGKAWLGKHKNRTYYCVSII